MKTTQLADRMAGAVWGQLVGDAACLGSHWVYDLNELARLFPAGVNGFEPSREGHYHFGKQSGDQTHYGDAALLLLASVAELGRFDAGDFGRRFVALFGSADYHGYRDHATRDTLARYRAFAEAAPENPFDFQQGADDDQPATVTRLTPLVAAHGREADLLDTVATATRVCQHNERAIAYAQGMALLLQHLFAGLELPAAARAAAGALSGAGPTGAEVAGKIGAALAARDQPVEAATLGFGQSCPLAGSFPAALQAALAHEDDFVAAVLAAARAGGDNAARAAMIGAWLGARHGLAAVPATWRERLTARETIARDLARLLATVAA
jgi:ADP-ribosylglycohydrolase